MIEPHQRHDRAFPLRPGRTGSAAGFTEGITQTGAGQLLKWRMVAGCVEVPGHDHRAEPVIPQLGKTSQLCPPLRSFRRALRRHGVHVDQPDRSCRGRDGGLTHPLARHVDGLFVRDRQPGQDRRTVDRAQVVPDLIGVGLEESAHPEFGEILHAHLLQEDDVRIRRSQVAAESADIGIVEKHVGGNQPQSRSARRSAPLVSSLVLPADPDHVGRGQHSGHGRQPPLPLHHRADGQRIGRDQQAHPDPCDTDQHRVALRPGQSDEPDRRHADGESPGSDIPGSDIPPCTAGHTDSLRAETIPRPAAAVTSDQCSSR